MLRKFTISVLLSAAMAALAAQPPATGDSATSVKAAKVQKIVDAMSFSIQPGGISLTGSDLSQLDTTLGPTAESYAAELDPANKVWNRTHPKWLKVVESIKGDVRSSMLAKISELATRTMATIRDEFSSRVTESDLNAALAFFESPEGKRYLAFERALDVIVSDGMKSLMLMVAQNRKINPPKTPSEAALKERTRLLGLSNFYLITQAQFEQAKAARRDTSGFAAAGFMMGMIASLKDEALDGLSRTFSEDLGRFEEFQQSPDGKRFNAAFFGATAALGESAGNDMKALQNDIRATNIEQWRKTYRREVSISEEAGK